MPYREPGNPESGITEAQIKAIKKMEDEINNEKEGKLSIKLPEKVKTTDKMRLVEFENALESNIKPEEIVFYSLATGILRFSKTIDKDKKIIYMYVSKNEESFIIIKLEDSKAIVDHYYSSK